MYLPLNFLKSITGDFSKEQELGRGAFGVVYKGILQDRKTIAVKKLLETHLDDDQFHNEVTYLIGLKHENVVQLLGYCAESRWEATQVSGNYVMAEIRHRLICFEYMNNKSLDVYLSAEHCGLEWHKRFEIIRGICYGLHYLHKECNIIHLDLKPHNILMDDNMVPKIADFGTSRLFGQQQSRIITKNLVGTFGYMAPEYLNKGLISTRSDIFSLGVIIIELITGSRDYPENSEALFEHFIKDVVEKWRIRLEKTSKYTLYSQQVEVCTVIGLRCVDSNPKQRPAAWDIIEMLNATECESMCSGVNEEPLIGETGWSEFVNIKEKVPQRLPAPAPSVLPYKTANVRDHYGIGNRLGMGLFGTTYKCVRNADGAEYACKSIPKRKLLCRQDYEDALFVHIVMELCTGGDLLDRIAARGHYSERAAAKLFRKIIGIVGGCHSLGVIHGDFKPENLLFVTNAEDAPLKATDFEFSQFYMPGDKFSYGVVGSPRPYYVAPEVIRKCYGPEADIWSVGVILYILLSGIPPFWAGHPWILDDAVAPDKPTDSAVLSRLKHFSTMNMFTKMALKVWRFTYPGRYNAPVCGSWSFFKTCWSEKLASWCEKQLVCKALV